MRIMDEVDMLLHPLRSELNFPIGARDAIDFLDHGYRYRLPIFILDAIFVTQGFPVSMEGVDKSATAMGILARLKKAVEDGSGDENASFQSCRPNG